MKFNRSVFWKMIGIFAILDLCIFMAGCGDWETQASSIITLLGPAIQAVIAILAAFGVGVSSEVMATFQSWSTQAQTALVTIKGLITQYKSAIASAQPGILNEIITIVQTTSTNLTSLLTTLHITDPATQTKVEAVFAAVTGMLAAIAGLLPVVQGTASEKEKLSLYGAFKSKASTFRATFNAAAKVFGPQYEI